MKTVAAAGTAAATGSFGRTCGPITRQGELLRTNAGSELEAQRFQQGSILGDPGGPSALDAIPSLEIQS